MSAFITQEDRYSDGEVTYYNGENAIPPLLRRLNMKEDTQSVRELLEWYDENLFQVRELIAKCSLLGESND